MININKKSYITVSEFANLAGISRQALIFYDTQNVFSPSYKDENGYRYYDLSQIDLIVTIQALKSIGLSLKEIKSYIETRNASQTYSLFHNQIKKLTLSREKLDHTIKMMNDKCAVIDKAMQVNTDIIYVEYHPKTYIIKSKEIPYDTSTNIQHESLSEHLKYRREHNFHCGRELGGIVPWKSIYDTHTQSTYYSWYYTVVDNLNSSYQDEIYIDVKPAGNYLVVYHKGSYIETYHSYHLFSEYAKIHNVKLHDYSYEESLIDEVSEANPDNYITQISIMFEKI